MNPGKSRGQSGPSSIPPVLPGTAADTTPAWELVAAGRYMPRRIRGSFPGRELG